MVFSKKDFKNLNVPFISARCLYSKLKGNVAYNGVNSDVAFEFVGRSIPVPNADKSLSGPQGVSLAVRNAT